MNTLSLFLCALMLAGPVLAEEDPNVLVKVNGAPVTRAEIQERLWAQFANDALNVKVDELVAQQATADFEAKAQKKDRDAWKKEIDARVKRIRDQFKDEAAFSENLKRAGTTLDDLRKRIEGQVVREQLVIQAKKLEVTPAEVKEFYETNKAKLGNQESVRLRHILVGDEKQARDLLVAIKVGADFGRLAQELSLDAGSKERGGDVGFISSGMLMPDIEKVALTLKPGEVSDVIKTQLGFHLIKAEEKRASKPAVFKDVEKDITQALLAQKINQAWPVLLKEKREASKIELSPSVTQGAPNAGAPQPAPVTRPN